MGSPELAQYADFYADMTRRFGLTGHLELWRDISERLHQLTSEPEDVTYRDVTANGVPAILVTPADSSLCRAVRLLLVTGRPPNRLDGELLAVGSSPSISDLSWRAVPLSLCRRRDHRALA